MSMLFDVCWIFLVRISLCTSNEKRYFRKFGMLYLPKDDKFGFFFFFWENIFPENVINGRYSSLVPREKNFATETEAKKIVSILNFTRHGDAKVSNLDA